MGGTGLDWTGLTGAVFSSTAADIMRNEDIGVRRGLGFRWGDWCLGGEGEVHVCMHSAFMQGIWILICVS